MIARAGSGWQTVLADLSLILFMVTASAVSQQPDTPRPPVTASPRAEPLARWRAGPGAPPLPEWLAAQGADLRQQLTIIAQYPPGGLAAALEEARALAREAGRTGLPTRVVVEPGGEGASATLAFDLPDPRLARGLREAGQQQPTGTPQP